MSQSRISFKQGLLAMSALCAFSATAAWPQQAARTPESSANFKFECDNAGVCAQSSSQREKLALEELEAVKAWFKTMGYPESRLPPGKNFPQGKIITIIGAKGGCPDDALACVREDLFEGIPGEPAYFRVRANTLNGDLDTLRGALAHEYMHSLIIIDSRFKWMNEALGDAVEFRWMAKKHGHPFPEVHPGYVMDLDKPFSRGSAGGYEKAPYFGFLASKIGGKGEPFKNLAPIFNNWTPKTESDSYRMGGLYDSNFVPEHAKFSKIFPEFIAKYNNIEETITYENEAGVVEKTIKRYYNKIDNKDLGPIEVGKKYSENVKVTVNEFSAMPVTLSPSHITFGRRDGQLKAVDLLAVVNHEITKAPDIDQLSLIFEHKATPDRRHSYLTLLEPSYFFGERGANDTGLLRVVNAGKNPSDTRKQEGVEIDLNIDSVAIGIPQCITIGKQSLFKLTGANASEVTNFRLEASAGRFGSGNDRLVYHPPASPQEVTFHLVIESPITRATEGIAPVSRGEKKIELGKQNIGKNLCSIRMNIYNSKNQYGSLTQDFDRQFTEMKADKNSALYVRREEMIAKSKGKWSPPLSGELVNMMLKQMPIGSGAMGSLLSNLPGGRGGGVLGSFAEVPFLTTELFSRKNIGRLLGDEQMKPELITCPDGSGECEQYAGTIQNHSVKTIYDKQNQLINLELDREKMTFEYNVPTEDIPPGWDVTYTDDRRPSSIPNS